VDRAKLNSSPSRAAVGGRRASFSRKSTVASMGETLPVFSEHVLCTNEVRQDAAKSQDLFFHEVGKLTLKGYTDPLAAFLIGALLVSTRDSQADLRNAFFINGELADEGDGVMSSTLSEKTEGSKALVKTEDSNSFAEDAEAWRAAYSTQQNAPLSYAQYCALLPAYFGVREMEEVQTEAADYVWIRSSGGDPIRIAELVRRYTGDNALGKYDDREHCWYLFKSEFMDLLDVASQVPPDISRQLLLGLSKLTPLNQLILKVLSVLGGVGPTELIRHLLTSVPIVCSQWVDLCDAFEQRYASLDAESALPKSLRPQKVDILIVVLEDLQEHGVLEIDGEGDLVNCKDFLLVDTVYSTLTFAHRKVLHAAAVTWMRTAHIEIEEQVTYLPNIVHHLMLSDQEVAAATLFDIVHKLGSTNYMGEFMVKQVQWYLDVHVIGDEYDRKMAFLRAEQALPAIPSLRGLAKAIQQNRCSKVSKAVKRFSGALFKLRSP